MRKLITPPPIIIGIAAMLLFSCQKEVSTSKESSVFNAAAAKEWYYAEFKKSAEWRGSDMKGKKLPDWSSGVYKKIGNYEVVEFPLIKATKRFELMKDNSISAEDTRRIMESSVNSILFIRKGKQIFVREVQYIPALQYFTASNFDISRNKISAIEKTFSGQIVIKKWNGAEVGRNVLVNGKIIKRYKLDNVLAKGLQRTQSCQVGQLEITEWARDCEVHIYGDGMVTNECGQWYTTGNTWCVDDENGQIPACSDPGSPECFCELVGNCEDPNSGGGNQQTCQEAADEIFSSAHTMAEKSGIEECGNTGTTRYKCYQWKIYSVSKGLIPMYLVSKDKATQVKNGNIWSFTSLDHQSIEKAGTEILYSVSTENVVPTSTLSPHSGISNQVGNMHITFTVKVSVICDGLPVVFSDPTSTSQSWHVNE